MYLFWNNNIENFEITILQDKEFFFKKNKNNKHLYGDPRW